jgi:uncharacterized protein (TIGR00369 family)
MKDDAVDPGPSVDRESVLKRVEQALASPEQVFGNFFLSRLLDLTVSYDDENQRCIVDLPFSDFLRNPQGSLHGGVVATAMDISMGHLCHRYLSTAMTVDMQLRFLRPLYGPSRCEAGFLRVGRRIVHIESRLYDDKGRLAVFASGAWHRLDAVQNDTTT